jgi:hypothetical protein
MSAVSRIGGGLEQETEGAEGSPLERGTAHVVVLLVRLWCLPALLILAAVLMLTIAVIHVIAGGRRLGGGPGQWIATAATPRLVPSGGAA